MQGGAHLPIGLSHLGGAEAFGRETMKRFMMLVALSGGLVLAACNTVRGAGEDVQSVANEVDEDI
jgi:predicted small secreted protein